MTITYILTALPILPSAASPETPITNIGRTICHNRLSGKDGRISFYSPELPWYDFAIVTGYRNFYPDVLKCALQVQNWRLLPANDAHCGWHKATSEHSFLELNNRGDIYWRYNDTRRQSQSDNTNTSLHPNAEIDGQISVQRQLLPSNATLHAISRILERNRPTADIYELSTIILGYVSGFLAFLLLLSLVHRCSLSGPWVQATSHTNSNDIELEPSKSQLSELSQDTRRPLSHTRIHENGFAGSMRTSAPLAQSID
ncbi:hypothetical protein IQ07DRAFT_631090 [Pyrenochaeta sp. DS3sAY3a]|nr:hypothetical protein IQ07DRAFT_631090 [Pyrenochaeta sp. DS3sAY3a]